MTLLNARRYLDARLRHVCDRRYGVRWTGADVEAVRLLLKFARQVPSPTDKPADLLGERARLESRVRDAG